jgi:hypothetical protein
MEAQVAQSTEETAVAERDGGQAGRSGGPEFEINVKSGPTDERVIRLGGGRRAREIVEIFAAERSVKAEELLLVIEGDAEPMKIDVVVDEAYPHHRRHHVHHAGLVDVLVYYQNKVEHREFRRHATVNDVLQWALKAFGIDPSMWTEFELTLHGQKEALPGNEHIGHLAGPHKKLELDLVRGDISNGSGG